MSKKPHHASKRTHRAPSEGSLEALLLRFRDQGDTAALTELFDTAAPGLRRLARRLTGPRRHDLADDALQETFLALVEKPERFDESRRLLPWLASVLVHRLRSLQERESRVFDESRLAERGVDSPAESALYSELAAHVELQVKKLPPTVREAVHGKVLRGEDVAVLSRELGISSGTFRVRLHRGLNQLRAALPKSLLGALGALGLRDRSYAAVRARVLSAGSAPTGATVISAWTAIGFALSCTVGVILWLSQSDENATGRELAANRSEGELAVESPDEAELAPLTETPDANIGADRRVAASQPATLRVAVLDRENGAPREAIEVRLHYLPAEELGELTETTDSSGFAEFSVQPHRGLWTARIDCGGTTTAASLYIGSQLRPGENREETMKVGSGATLSGRVVDTEGHAIPGALVRAWCNAGANGPVARQVYADEAGHYRVEHLGPEFVLRATADGYASHTGLRGGIDDGVDLRDQDLIVAPAVTLRGIVLDSSDQPVVGAEAEMTNGLIRVVGPGVVPFRDAEGQAVTDESGRFEITGLPQAERRVVIEHPSFERFYSQVTEPFSKEKAFVLERALTVQGLVLDAEGQPAAGARIRGWPRNEAAYRAQRWIVADDQGRFSMEGFKKPEPGYNAPPGVAVRHEGHAVRVVDSLEPSVQPTEPVVIRLTERARVLSGTVVDDSGAPLRGVEVRVVGTRECETGTTWAGQPSTWEFAADLSETRTDESGEFQFGELYPGSFELRVSDPRDKKRWASYPVKAGAEGVEIVLTQEALKKVVLVGQVRRSLDGSPIQEFSIHPMRAIDEDNSQGYTFDFDDELGQFRIEGLEAGRYVLGAKSDGFAEEKKASQFLGDGEHTFVFDLVPAIDLTLQLELEGERNEGFSVTARNRFGQELHFQKDNETGTHEYFRGEQLTVSGLPAELVFLTVASSLRSRVIEVDLSNEPADPLVVRFDALPTVSVDYFAIEADSDVPLEELEKHLRGGRNEEALEWWKANREKVGPPRGDVVLSFKTAQGELLAKESFVPRGLDEFSASGEHHYPGFSSWSSPDLGAVTGRFTAPSSDLLLEIESRTYRNEEVSIEAEPAGEGPGTLIVLRRP